MSQQTFTVSENARVEIRNCHNRVTIIGWDDVQRVGMDYAARQEGNTIVIENADRVEARVPRAATVFIAECEADVRVEDLDGRVELSHIGGDVSLRNLRGEVLARDLDGDLAARDLGSLKSEGTWDGDVAARNIESLSAEKIDGDLALTQVGAIQITKVKGDVTVSQAKGLIAIDKVEGDLVVSGLRAALAAPEVEGDAVVSVAEIAPLELRAEGDVVLNLPEGANAELDLVAARGDLIANADVTAMDESDNQLRGTLGSGGAKIHAESVKGDLVFRVGGAKHAHMRGRVHIDTQEFAGMGQRIAREVRETMRDSMRDSIRESMRGVRDTTRSKIKIEKHFGRRHRHHEDDDRVEDIRVDEKPRGPAAGSPERQAILDAIARGEMNVDDAIKKLRGEE